MTNTENISSATELDAHTGKQNTIPTMFDILSDIEGACAPVGEILSSLYLFDELLRREVEQIDLFRPYTAEVFKRRYELFADMLRMIQRELEERWQDYQKQIDNAYRVYAQVKQEHN